MESGPPRLMLRDPEDLRSIGVTPPQVAEVARLLNARLMSSKFSFLNVDEAEKTIVGEVLAHKAGGGK